MIFRKADEKDFEILVNLHSRQLLEEGQDKEGNIDVEFLSFLFVKTRSKELVEWVAEEDDRIIAMGGILFMEYPPSLNNPSGKKGYITNMYTIHEYRGQGIAGKVLEKLEKEAKTKGITRLVLHASEMGKKPM